MFANKQKRTEGCSKLKRSVDITRSEMIVLNKSKIGQYQVSDVVSVLCWLAAPVANVLWKLPLIGNNAKNGNNVQFGNKVTI